MPAVAASSVTWRRRANDSVTIAMTDAAERPPKALINTASNAAADIAIELRNRE
jgi:hypothetical protein